MLKMGAIILFGGVGLAILEHLLGIEFEPRWVKLPYLLATMLLGVAIWNS